MCVGSSQLHSASCSRFMGGRKLIAVSGGSTHRLKLRRELLLRQLERLDLCVVLLSSVRTLSSSSELNRPHIADHNNGNGGATYTSSKGSGWTTKK